ncbi:hypothetical protein [Mesorhizobium sp. B2-4-14]|uniref:hypothetical protein n=1 Tax=Mesorhizobium sp. B2-4-14 TaxID=2589935 RepID=UPI0015E45110|nr:hypothetical protein [Mesorhizobium sp. B2-4-14]
MTSSRPPSVIRRFIDRVFMHLSRNICIDGLWVGVFADENDTEALCKLEKALHLIKAYDMYRYRRILKEIDRIWSHPLPVKTACFVESLRRCLIDNKYVLTSTPEIIASTLVHEATHGRLIRHNIGYSEEIRSRVERVCIRQERAFALKIPQNGDLLQRIERKLAIAPDYWTDHAALERHREGMIAMAEDVGLPNWLGRALLNFRERMGRVKS